ncbi:hypothetical protein N1851_018827 [Merluccius polli]|uniref:Cryptic/Cripto CFC domain-containing protein n=1 Tax=Merluccius polli TaxID=89951 RepID=A0AA47MMB8_MERPO|nr:hypothetical protein N1851_018827 [Merluccius polli]
MRREGSLLGAAEDILAGGHRVARSCGGIPHEEWVQKGCAYCRCGTASPHLPQGVQIHVMKEQGEWLQLLRFAQVSLLVSSDLHILAGFPYTEARVKSAPRPPDGMRGVVFLLRLLHLHQLAQHGAVIGGCHHVWDLVRLFFDAGLFNALPAFSTICGNLGEEKRCHQTSIEKQLIVHTNFTINPIYWRFGRGGERGKRRRSGGGVGPEGAQALDSSSVVERGVRCTGSGSQMVQGSAGGRDVRQAGVGTRAGSQTVQGTPLVSVEEPVHQRGVVFLLRLLHLHQLAQHGAVIGGCHHVWDLVRLFFDAGLFNALPAFSTICGNLGEEKRCHQTSIEKQLIVHTNFTINPIYWRFGRGGERGKRRRSGGGVGPEGAQALDSSSVVERGVRCTGSGSQMVQGSAGGRDVRQAGVGTQAGSQTDQGSAGGRDVRQAGVGTRAGSQTGEWLQLLRFAQVSLLVSSDLHIWAGFPYTEARVKSAPQPPDGMVDTSVSEGQKYMKGSQKLLDAQMDKAEHLVLVQPTLLFKDLVWICFSSPMLLPVPLYGLNPQEVDVHLSHSVGLLFSFLVCFEEVLQNCSNDPTEDGDVTHDVEASRCLDVGDDFAGQRLLSESLPK